MPCVNKCDDIIKTAASSGDEGLPLKKQDDDKAAQSDDVSTNKSKDTFFTGKICEDAGIDPKILSYYMQFLPLMEAVLKQVGQN